MPSHGLLVPVHLYPLLEECNHPFIVFHQFKLDLGLSCPQEIEVTPKCTEKLNTWVLSFEELGPRGSEGEFLEVIWSIPNFLML